MSSQHYQEHAQREEQQVHRHESEAIRTHVLLRVAQRTAGQVLLHHVLIQPRHHHHDEHTAQELLPEVLRRHPVIPHEHARMTVGSHRPRGFHPTKAQLAHHLIYNKAHGNEHTGCLKRIGPHQRLDAATSRIEPHNSHHHAHREHERHAQRVEHKALQNGAEQIELDGGGGELREQEEARTRQIRPLSQPLTQIAVDGGQVQFVVKGQQHERHHEIAHDEAQTRLNVGHVHAHHHPRHAHERHTRDGSAHHAERHHPPRRTAVGTEEGLVGGTPRCQSAEEQQQGKIH